MAAYHPTTLQSIADVGTGIRCRTGSLAASTILAQGQTEIFTVYGAILVTQLYLEVITEISANAAQLLFTYTATTPVVALNEMCIKCASLSGAAVGLRVVYVGGAVGGTTALLTDSAGLSDITCVSPVIVGGIGFIGTIGTLSSDATCTTGALRGYIHYYPYTADAYVAAVA